jgi:hypothetical protein
MTDWNRCKNHLPQKARRAAKHLKKAAHRAWRRTPITETPVCRLDAWKLT